MRTQTLAAPAAVACAVLLTAGTAFAGYSGQQYASQAKVALVQARAIALKAVPGGKIVGEELEKENGGSGLRYSFDIKTHRQTREVGVDAKSGTVLENSSEGENPD